jgi:DNA repair exonuclease SbcCD nuclease subunit
MTMRIAFISDAHLFQSFIKNYNPLHDFERALSEIKQRSPDLLLIAGDVRL